MTQDAHFAGVRVAAFESRRADDLARLIEKSGGQPFVSPSMREVAATKNQAAIDFANRVMTGEIDIVIFMTGVGIRLLMQQLDRQIDVARFVQCLSDITTVARGPKPVAALKAIGVDPTHRVSEPNTWREVLQTLEKVGGLANAKVAIQEYGEPNASLVAGLEARGAQAIQVQVYHWEFPEDLGPLDENIRAICAGQRDVALFTSQHQAVNLLRRAKQLNVEDELRRQLQHVLIGSIGPTTSEGLREHGLTVDFEPPHSKMGHLVLAAAERYAERKTAPQLQQGNPAVNLTSTSAVDTSAPWYNSHFLKACRREPVDRTPIWLMRQAGRYLPEYRAIREKTTFLEFCKSPALSAEVMLTTVERLGVDAAIIFSDLLPILEPMGLNLEFAQGEGPVIHNPIRSAGEIDRLRELDDLSSLEFVMETVRQTRAGLKSTLPVIGFAGAPFTLASYAIEGGGSRNYLHTKTLMYRDFAAWDVVMSRLSRAITRYLNAQIAAGAQAVQLFDSWAGCLGVGDYRRFVLPYTKSIIDGITPGTPVINFATGNPALLPLLAEAGGAVIGIDWRIELDEAWKTVGYDHGVQGNLDPTVLFAEPTEIRRRAEGILAQAAGRPGHIFNLGHGVLPGTPVENVLDLIHYVQNRRIG